MKKYELELKLNSLYRELAKLSSCTEEQACYLHNVDSKKEIEDILNEEIDFTSSLLEEIEEEENSLSLLEEIEEERSYICLSQGLSRYC